MLSSLLGEGLDGQLAEAGKHLVKVDLPGTEGCYALRGVSRILLASFWRLRMVRRYILEQCGAEVFLSGLTPGIVADGEFPVGSSWWRVWADVGGVAPEALRPICHPPITTGGPVTDVLLTVNEERLSRLVALLEQFWPGSGPIRVQVVGSPAHRAAHPPRIPRHTFTGYRSQAIRAFLKGRSRCSQEQARLRSLPEKLSPHAWDSLVTVGNLPLLTPTEIARLLAHSLAEADEISDRLAKLRQWGLLRAGQKEAGEERLVLTGKAIKLLALFWGCREADLARLLPWPQRRDAQGRLSYSLRWATQLADHTREARQFALSVVEGARRGSSAASGVSVEVVTLIGGRVLFSGPSDEARDKRGWVIPDGLLRAHTWRRFWQNGAYGPVVETGQEDLLVEIDRATNSLPRLVERLDEYKKVWQSLQARRPVRLVWVINGTPWRQTQILSEMRARGLSGCAVRLEELVIGAQHPYWRDHPPTSLSFAPRSLGGMAPMRPIWQDTAGQKHSLLLEAVRPAGGLA